jgi:hypothetical protein
MHLLIAVLLSFLVSLNAAYAAVLGVCDVMEHGKSDLTIEQTSHFGHHGHAAEDGAVSGDDTRACTGAGDNCHAHASFSPMILSEVQVPGPLGRSPFVGQPPSRLVSVPPIGMEYPPRSVLA